MGPDPMDEACLVYRDMFFAGRRFLGQYANLWQLLQQSAVEQFSLYPGQMFQKELHCLENMSKGPMEEPKKPGALWR